MLWKKIIDNKLPDIEGYYLFSDGDEGFDLLYYHKNENTWTRPTGKYPQIISGLDIYEVSEITELFKYYTKICSGLI